MKYKVKRVTGTRVFVTFPFGVISSLKRNVSFSTWEGMWESYETHMKEVANERFCPQGIYNLTLDKVDPHGVVT